MWFFCFILFLFKELTKGVRLTMIFTLLLGLNWIIHTAGNFGNFLINALTEAFNYLFQCLELRALTQPLFSLLSYLAVESFYRTLVSRTTSIPSSWPKRAERAAASRHSIRYPHSSLPGFLFTARKTGGMATVGESDTLILLSTWEIMGSIPANRKPPALKFCWKHVQ